MDQDKKRELRQLKREIKRKGGKLRRRQLKQGLAENPEEAHDTVVDFGRLDQGPQRPRPRPSLAECRRRPRPTRTRRTGTSRADPGSTHSRRDGGSSVLVAWKSDSTSRSVVGESNPSTTATSRPGARRHRRSPHGAADRVGERGGRLDPVAELGGLVAGVLAGEVAGVVLGVPGGQPGEPKLGVGPFEDGVAVAIPAGGDRLARRGGGAGSPVWNSPRTFRPTSDQPAPASRGRGRSRSAGRAGRGTSRGGGSARSIAAAGCRPRRPPSSRRCWSAWRRRPSRGGRGRAGSPPGSAGPRGARRRRSSASAASSG